LVTRRILAASKGERNVDPIDSAKNPDIMKVRMRPDGGDGGREKERERRIIV
jgi:hypothetical protein